MEVYEISIDDQTGVTAIALVDAPAIERQWMAFNKPEAVKMEFKVKDAARRIISGPLMVANLPIVRYTKERQEFYVVFRPDAIEKIQNKYMMEGRMHDVNLMHNNGKKPDGVYMIESFLIDSTRGINTPEGYDTLPDGSWFGSFKVNNDEVWASVLSGKFKGFSVEGEFIPVVRHERSKDWVDKMIDIING